MSSNEKDQVIEAEEQLRIAMLNSDVASLNNLLSDELVFTSHTGQVLTKEDDLAAHTSGKFKINELLPSDQNVKIISEVGIVTVKVKISGTFDEKPSEGNFRFTRVWKKNNDNRWCVIAAHSCLTE